ncbi:MBL fold metallo-hydrolase [Nitrococcus mobilis]|uniref:Ribonuclease Z n=1 Tax=Nitrococcus mobilis Nb-231 TaxID=314278 RepID=A4BPY8_9GAMM|nr:MBL fold metallo-hydrolase [Nitrococcus mobilis]EAR22143.1 ribonuclease Z [Nitrococcus mobilis Nb-231]
MSNAFSEAFPGITFEALLKRMRGSDARVLIVGASGIGKTTLVGQLCRALYERGCVAGCLSADVGSPGFGVPGAVNLAQWGGDEGWRLLDLEAVCSLDAARFRLPLITATVRLLARQKAPVRVLDAPGLMRGVPAAELLEALVQRGGVDLVVALVDGEAGLLLVRELSALSVEVRQLDAGQRAHRPRQLARAINRTQLWNAYLANALECAIDLERLPVVGTPPPIEVPAAWHGRQVGLGDGDGTRDLAEIIALEGRRLRLRARSASRAPSHVLVRDAVRNDNGYLVTARPFVRAASQVRPPPDVMPFVATARGADAAAVVRVGPAFATLVNGVFGDPLLHLRLRQERRSLLFDLGDSGRLPARIAHQVTDVFITHAHFDHIGGFLWLLRSRLGVFPVCRLYGPPGLMGHIEGLLRGILWDRIGARAPHFEVAELHGDRLLRWHLRAGQAASEYLGEMPSSAGLLREEPGFSVSGITLDHGTPVLAFAFELPRQVHIRKSRLRASGLSPGPWLMALKAAARVGDRQRVIRLPNGARKAAGLLLDDMGRIAPVIKLVYATDFGDTRSNRALLTQFADQSQAFFCEASFLEVDRGRALRTGHLTARACGEIAAGAAVARLVPFHFSRRYENNPHAVYAEVEAACSRFGGTTRSVAKVD